MKKALILLGHGSRLKEANESLYSLAKIIKSKSSLAIVQPAFLQLASPTLREGIESCLAQGASEIIVHPYFLYPGAHVLHDIPAIIEAARQDHPQVRIRLTPPLGVDDKLAEIVLERVTEIEKEANLPPDQELDSQQLDQLLSDPDLIERRSLEIISAKIQEEAFPIPLRPIIKRVIHATADLAIVSDIRFSPHFYQQISTSLLQGAPIITDVFMLKEALNLSLLSKFRNPLFCFIRDREVSEMAEKEKITRSMAAVRKGASLYPEGIYLFGNAPTALREMIQLYRWGKIVPAAVVGCPVGFVGASEVKRELCQTDLPYFTCLGAKGGSAMAAAVINALLRELAKIQCQNSQNK
ncbi:MAG: precorrin-8X methylmutase [bacterium]|nr:precorrin-8X methylmutase [bacterium]